MPHYLPTRPSSARPVARSNFDALRRLSADNGVAILADESLSSLASAFELARHHCVDAFSLKLCNMGGVANTLKVAAIAEARSDERRVGKACVSTCRSRG